MELTTCLKYIHDNILSLCTTATVMNSIIEFKQVYVCGAFVGGAFVHAPHYLADAFSIISNNYIYIYIYIYTYIYMCGQVGRYMCVRAAFIR